MFGTGKDRGVENSFLQSWSLPHRSILAQQSLEHGAVFLPIPWMKLKEQSIHAPALCFVEYIL